MSPIVSVMKVGAPSDICWRTRSSPAIAFAASSDTGHSVNRRSALGEPDAAGSLDAPSEGPGGADGDWALAPVTHISSAPALSATRRHLRALRGCSYMPTV